MRKIKNIVDQKNGEGFKTSTECMIPCTLRMEEILGLEKLEQAKQAITKKYKKVEDVDLSQMKYL